MGARRLLAFRLALAVTAFAPGLAASAGDGTARHFAPNGNFDAAGAFAPGRAGFNVADVADRAQLDALPEGVRGLVWVGTCAGADVKFRALVDSVADHPKLYGFYLMDDPDPTGRWRALCRADDLRAEADWIHARRPDAIAFVALMNLGSSAEPAFSPDYAPSRSGVDLFAVSPYPCRVDWAQCDYAMIDRFVAAAQASGVPRPQIAPTYQTFGGGGWRTDGGGPYRLPRPDELRAMFDRWDRLVPAPALDYAYSWGPQRADAALAGAPDLQAEFAKRQRTDAAR